uniref:Uncharacterized protein n=1 Tax=Arundo donax TaxID=35708 RepID=A0A0A9EQN3_ARUDO
MNLIRYICLLDPTNIVT